MPMTLDQVQTTWGHLKIGRKVKWQGWVVSFSWENGYKATKDGQTLRHYESLPDLVELIDQETYDYDGVRWDI